MISTQCTTHTMQSLTITVKYLVHSSKKAINFRNFVCPGFIFVWKKIRKRCHSVGNTWHPHFGGRYWSSRQMCDHAPESRPRPWVTSDRALKQVTQLLRRPRGCWPRGLGQPRSQLGQRDGGRVGGRGQLVH